MEKPLIKLKSFIAIGLLLLTSVCAEAQADIQDILITSNIEYCKAVDHKGETRSLLLDVYQLPVQKKTLRPVIILIHGGGFGGGDKGYTKPQGSFYPDIAKAFARSGYVALSINYRLWPGCPVDSFHIELSNTISDVSAAVKWINTNRREYGIDTTKIIIGGDSAGGGIAVNSSYCNTQLFAGCIDMWGGLPPYGSGKPKVPVNKCPVTAKTPPTCIIHGTRDPVVPYSTSIDLVALLTAAGIYNELHPLEGAEHYPNNLASQIIQIMLAFGDRIIKGEL